MYVYIDNQMSLKIVGPKLYNYALVSYAIMNIIIANT